MAATPVNPCNPFQPLINFEENGVPPELYYDMTQGVCVKTTTNIPLNIPSGWFDVTKDLNKIPNGNVFDRLESITPEQAHQLLVDDILGGTRKVVVNNSRIRRTGKNALDSKNIKMYEPKIMDGYSKLRGDMIPVDTEEEMLVDVPLPEVLRQISLGRAPMVKYNVLGTPKLTFLTRPVTPKPQLYFVFKYKMCTYLGKVGAGKVVKTFSLLPGEKTTISVRSYRKDTSTQSTSENVLESFNDSVIDEFQNNFNSENGTNVTNQSTSETVSAFNFDIDGSISIPLLSDFGITGGGSSSGQTSVASSSTAFVNIMKQAIAKHVSNSAQSRQVEVNTESTQSTTIENETSTVREIENINQSRVLNFVFRQLQQEYNVVLYLDDVQIGYTNGYPESTFTVPLSNINSILEQVLGATHVADVRLRMLSQLCKIYDITDNPVQFIEEVTRHYTDCIGGTSYTFDEVFIRKAFGLTQTYTPPDGGRAITVPGVIVHAEQYTLPTDSLLVESLLGQAEALDCYNTNLQTEAVQKAQLDNQVTAMQVHIVGAIGTPAEQAIHFKKVFGDCCDVPQSGCGCGCDENAKPTGGVVIPPAIL